MTDCRKLYASGGPDNGIRPTKPPLVARRSVRNLTIASLAFFAGLLGVTPLWRDGGRAPAITLAAPAFAIDLDLRQPMFSQPRQQRVRQPPASGAAPPRDRRVQPYQPAQQRGFMDSLFGAPQRPQYQPGYRPRAPAAARPSRPEPRRAAPRRAPAPIVRQAIEKTEFVYVLGPGGDAGLVGALEFVLADRPIVGVKRLQNTGEGPPQASGLLAALPQVLAPAGKSAVVVIVAAANWGELTEAQLTTLVADVSTAMASRNSPVIWVGLPPMADKLGSARAAAVNGALRAAASKADGGFVDAWAVFADDNGGFAAWGPAVSGDIVRLREDGDGDMTRAGERKLAHFIVAEVRRIQARLASAAKPQIGVPVDPFSLPGPQLPPAAAATPKKPDVGPVTPLNYVMSAPNGKLDPLDAGGRELPDIATRQALQEGAPARAAPGRADDFSWPKKPGNNGAVR